MGDRGRSGFSAGGRGSAGGGRNDRSPHRRREDDAFGRDDRDRDSKRRDHNNPTRDPKREPGAGQGYAAMGSRSGQPMFSGQAFTENELLTDLPKKKFTGRCRLFVGNLPNEVTEQELKDLFSPHGDIAECYLSGKGFSFLRMDTRAHAESAKETIDGKLIHGRPVRVRFAVHGAALRVKELSNTVSNEMLYHAFSHFGEVERAVHIVDEKGRPTGEGIVEFERKPSANEALHQIKDKVFLLTAGPKPLVVEPLEPRDEDDGLAERMIQRSAQLIKEREIGPRFPPPNSFEYAYGVKWKELYEVERRRRADGVDVLKQARARLEADMELAYQDYQAQMLREDLQRRQQELERLEAARRERMNQAQNAPPPFLPMRGPMFNGGSNPEPFNAFNTGAQGGPPPFANQQRQGGPQQGGPPQPFASGGDPNFMQGMQKLLQIIRPERGQDMGGPNGGGGPGGPPSFYGGSGGPPQMGGSHAFGGPPGPGPFDYPAEKRLRR